MGHIVICNKTDCRYNACRSCECDIIELDIDGACEHYEELSSHKEAGGFDCNAD